MNEDRLNKIEAVWGEPLFTGAAVVNELVAEVRRLRDGCTCGVADDAS
jgi:hypothetical protein